MAQCLTDLAKHLRINSRLMDNSESSTYKYPQCAHLKLHLCRRVTPKTQVGGDVAAIKYLLVPGALRSDEITSDYESIRGHNTTS